MPKAFCYLVMIPCTCVSIVHRKLDLHVMNYVFWSAIKRKVLGKDPYKMFVVLGETSIKNVLVLGKSLIIIVFGKTTTVF